MFDIFSFIRKGLIKYLVVQTPLHWLFYIVDDKTYQPSLLDNCMDVRESQVTFKEHSVSRKCSYKRENNVLLGVVCVLSVRDYIMSVFN